MNIKENRLFCVPFVLKHEILDNNLFLKFPTFSFLCEYHICSTYILVVYLTIYSFAMHWLTEALYWALKWGKWDRQRLLQIEVLIVKTHCKHKRLEISANILFTYTNYFLFRYLVSPLLIQILYWSIYFLKNSNSLYSYP